MCGVVRLDAFSPRAVLNRNGVAMALSGLQFPPGTDTVNVVVTASGNCGAGPFFTATVGTVTSQEVNFVADFSTATPSQVRLCFVSLCVCVGAFFFLLFLCSLLFLFRAPRFVPFFFPGWFISRYACTQGLTVCVAVANNAVFEVVGTAASLEIGSFVGFFSSTFPLFSQVLAD